MDGINDRQYILTKYNMKRPNNTIAKLFNSFALSI